MFLSHQPMVRRYSSPGWHRGLQVAEEVLLEEVTLEEQQEGTEHVRIWGKSVPRKVTAKCRGPEVGKRSLWLEQSE